MHAAFNVVSGREEILDATHAELVQKLLPFLALAAAAIRERLTSDERLVVSEAAIEVKLKRSRHSMVLKRFGVFEVVIVIHNENESMTQLGLLLEAENVHISSPEAAVELDTSVESVTQRLELTITAFLSTLAKYIAWAR